jgi:hypothetical protein
MSSITPEEVCKFKKPTDGFLCRLSDNKFNIDFLAFSIRDYDTQRTIFKVDRESSMDALAGIDLSTLDEDSLRKIDYKFESDVLSLPRITTELKFSVGANVVEEFRMIERHYFKGRLIKSFDFTFPFCIPKSTNTWTSEYELPPMDAALVDEIVKSPNLTQSDSFYFVKGKLIMHNKARYTYFYPPGREAKLEGKLGNNNSSRNEGKVGTVLNEGKNPGKTNGEGKIGK